ncbi:hypothetical protein KAI60_02800, partial [Candidatus Bathyarchaeota archaeon]|nr:hypothetical protein [Candidatus Bathyarchaeota archaeon]
MERNLKAEKNKVITIKVMIAFPSLPDSKRIPQLTKNRQFQWNHSPSTFIYPIIPAIAATLLKE